ncbi:MAG: transposase [Bacteroidetes bacterium]|nr:transposase [Bacteroidota bacterium]
MKNSKFTESKIVSILKLQDADMSVSEICRQHGISQPTFFNWKKKYSGMDATNLKRLKELEAENSRLKKMYADVSLQRDALKDLIEKKL